MRKNYLYDLLIKHKLNLADQLAAVRSILANERTYLSYQRTALTLLAAGFTFIKFFDLIWIIVLGWVFLPASIVTIILGTYRYRKMRNLIYRLEIRTDEHCVI